MNIFLLRKNACTHGCRIRLKKFLETPQGVVAVRHVARTSCTNMARGRGQMIKRLEAPCHCGNQWISTGWTCNSCYNTGTAWCFLERFGACSYEMATCYKEDWVRFHLARWWPWQQDDRINAPSLRICISMIHIMEGHRGQSCAKWMLQRVKSHFGLEILLPASMPMIAVDDDLIEYQRLSRLAQVASRSLKRCAHTDDQCLAQVVPARIYAVSQDVVDRQAHLLDSTAMAFGCWTQRHK